jgi:uncharacterized paraquat-inducible protein A
MCNYKMHGKKIFSCDVCKLVAIPCPKCGTLTDITPWGWKVPALCPNCNTEIEDNDKPINLGSLGYII